MKNEKGFTLISAIMYLLIATIVISLIVAISASVIKSFKVANDNDTKTVEMNKINMYMLTEMNIPNNKVEMVNADGTYISFSQGSNYVFQDNILYKDKYKIAEGIGSVANNKFFEVDQENGKTVLTINMQIDGKTEQSKYIFRNVPTVGNAIGTDTIAINAQEGSTINTINLILSNLKRKYTLYYVAVDAEGGYTPTNNTDLINFVKNGTNVNLQNANYSGAHIARGSIDVDSGKSTYTLTGLGIAGDAGLVGGVAYNIYIVTEDSNNNISDMTDLGYPQLAQGFDGGFGTSGNPYIIKSGITLSHMNYSVYMANANLYYKLQNNIDLSQYNTGEGWTPIGNATGTDTQFSGTFDGSGFAITNLTINNSTATEVGLFGASKGVIENVGIDSGNVKSTNSTGTKVGGLVGYVEGGSIINSYSNATVSNATGTDGGAGTGGLIGSLSGGTSSVPVMISKSYASGSVSGTQDVGGFVGDITSPTVATSFINIERCYATGDTTLSSGYQLGGFIGKVQGNSVKITNCYARGNVSSTSVTNTTGLERTGGFGGWIGDTTASTSASISYCYASGDVTSANTNISNANSGIGGFVGAVPNVATVTIQNCLAMNNKVSASAQYGKTGKFIGYRLGASPVFNRNYANSAMTTNGTATQITVATQLDITTYNLTAMLLASFYTTATNWTAAWDTTIWNLTNGALPTFVP
ncbi:MAG: hypothetical protein FWF46_01555 [Oscillospiraceae bacterium]|nr:hypothetical protein [Oscillospiraceae bacterium]